jgi:hypothetical protein
MALTPAQLTTLKAAILADTDAGVVAARAIRNDTALVAWCNSPGPVDAWQDAMTALALFEDATDVAKFDGLTAGKRDAWDLMLRFAPIDFSRQKNRKAAQDVWGNTDSVAVLQACRRKATRAEVYITPNIGGNQATTNTVTALKLNWTGMVSLNELSDALNAG